MGLPVFTSRGFPHTGILVRSDRGIERPQDLKGKKVAVPEYQQTSALWSRGILQHEFDVTPWDMEWYMERTEELSHGGATGFRPPEKLKFQRIQPPDEHRHAPARRENRRVAALSERSEPGRPQPCRSPQPAGSASAVPRRRCRRGALLQEDRLLPRQSLRRRAARHTERHPWVALNIYKAFVAAKEMAHAPGREVASIYFDLDLLPAASRRVLDVDPYPYGMQANRAMLESLVQFSHEQGLTSRRLTLEEVFHPATLEL